MKPVGSSGFACRREAVRSSNSCTTLCRRRYSCSFTCMSTTRANGRCAARGSRDRQTGRESAASWQNLWLRRIPGTLIPVFWGSFHSPGYWITASLAKPRWEEHGHTNTHNRKVLNQTAMPFHSSAQTPQEGKKSTVRGRSVCPHKTCSDKPWSKPYHCLPTPRGRGGHFPLEKTQLITFKDPTPTAPPPTEGGGSVTHSQKLKDFGKI